MSESTPRLLVVGPTYLNVYPFKPSAKRSATKYQGSIGGEAAWTTLVAALAVGRELQDTIKEASAPANDPDFNTPQANESNVLRAEYLTPRMQARATRKPGKLEQDNIYTSDIRIEDARISALTTLSADHPDIVHRAVRAVFRACNIEIVASPSRMPVDVYNSSDIAETTFKNRVFDKPPFDTNRAYRAFANGTEPTPTIVVFNGLVLGNEKTRDDMLGFANLLRAQGALVFADLRTPMDKETVGKWTKVAHIIKIGHNDLAALTGTSGNGVAATKLLNSQDSGLKFFIETKGSSGASMWWRSNRLNYRAAAPGGNYVPEIIFKAGAAFDANFALALLKHGINARNFDEALRDSYLIDHIGTDAVRKTTSFLMAANDIMKQKPDERPIAWRPITSQSARKSLIRLVHPKRTNG